MDKTKIILTTFIALVSLIATVLGISKNVVWRDEFTGSMKVIEKRLDRIENKLDRIIEKNYSNID